jgi:aminoglycoside phosphotransferase (APT) family kinase protein
VILQFADQRRKSFGVFYVFTHKIYVNKYVFSTGACKISLPSNTMTDNGPATACTQQPDVWGLAFKITIPACEETPLQVRWYEKVFLPAVALDELLQLAAESRGGVHRCTFGNRFHGVYNIVLVIVFDDGLEWIARLPKNPPRTPSDEDEVMLSEYGALIFLERIGSLPVPRPHGCNFTKSNPVHWPYIFMDKVSGIPLWQALEKKIIGGKEIYEVLRQLANFKKKINQHPLRHIGSLYASEYEGEFEYCVERQHSVWNRFEEEDGPRRDWGPFSTPLQYYANLHLVGWQNAMRECFNDEEEDGRWQLHLYLASILRSYAKPSPGGFYLAHDDLHDANIFVDEKGNITGIIDWEFHSTLPLYAANHYPLLLTDMEDFQKRYKTVFEDPRAELQNWRNFYAKQFEGDQQMEEYLANIDTTITLERLFRDNSFVTIKNVVGVCRFVDSPEILDQLNIPVPTRMPTNSPQSPLRNFPDCGRHCSDTYLNGATETTSSSEPSTSKIGVYPEPNVLQEFPPTSTSDIAIQTDPQPSSPTRHATTSPGQVGFGGTTTGIRSSSERSLNSAEPPNPRRRHLGAGFRRQFDRFGGKVKKSTLQFLHFCHCVGQTDAAATSVAKGAVTTPSGEKQAQATGE